MHNNLLRSLTAKAKDKQNLSITPKKRIDYLAILFYFIIKKMQYVRRAAFK